MAGLALALLVEVLLVLVVVSLGSTIGSHAGNDRGERVVRFRASPPRPETPEQQDEARPDKAVVRPSARAAPQPVQPEAATPRPAEPRPLPAPPLIQLSPAQSAAASAAVRPGPPRAPVQANRPMMGPPDTSPPSPDSTRVSGSGPNGEPLYAASWYREPYDDELKGYLSTATGPGWALIACRTVPDYRVEDCVKLDEYPNASNIARSVLAAAWQFRVRPPRVGGQLKIGEWVRIRIDYDLRPARR